MPVGDTDPDRLRIGDEVRLRVRAGLDAPVDRVFLRTAPDGEQVLRRAGRGRAGAGLPVVRDRDPADDAGDRLPVPGRRAGGHLVADRIAASVVRPRPTADDFRLVAGFDPPSWLADRVFYQVFPDRFANGDPANDVARRRVDLSRASPPDDVPGRSGRPTARAARSSSSAATSPGLEARLDHLVDLGVNAIYLNPVFDSRSNHGYDTIDYGHVAAHFGGDEALVSLRRATLARDIRVILDIAPNHTGAEHPWFLAAQADPSAPDRRLLHVPHAARRLRVVAGRQVAAQARLPRRRAARGDVRGPGRDPAPLARAAVLGRRLADRRGEHAGPPGPGPARAGGRPRDARGRQGREPRRVPDGRALLRRDRRAQRRPVGRRHELRGVHQARPRVAERRRAPQRGVRHRRRRRGPDDRRDGRLARRLPSGRSRGRSPAASTTCSAATTRRGSGRSVGDPGRLRAAFGLLFGYVGVPGFLYGDEVGLEGEEGNASRLAMPWDEDGLGPRPPRVHPRPRAGSAPGPGPSRPAGSRSSRPAPTALAFLRDTDDEQVIVVVVRGPGSRTGDLPVSHGAIADGTVFTSLLTGERATVAGGRLPLPPTPPGAAFWRSGE